MKSLIMNRSANHNGGSTSLRVNLAQKIMRPLTAFAIKSRYFCTRYSIEY